MIVSKEDFPVFELTIDNLVKRKDYVSMHEFIIHSSLDVIDNIQWNSNNMYLKTVDRFNELSVTCLLTPSSITHLFMDLDARFLLLHEGKNEDAIKNFFNEVYELFVKVCPLF